jgi:hypothetical protein
MGQFSRTALALVASHRPPRPGTRSTRIRTHLINRERVRCQRFGAAARREEEEYPLWIFDRRATPLQRQRSATLRAKHWRALGGVAPQSQNALAMLLRRSLPAARQCLAHPFPIYEMDSSMLCGSRRIMIEWMRCDEHCSRLAFRYSCR